ncbi:neurogenic protein big brain isoform X2 [Glossina fuscipes]|uniref:Neurogenic protein big brain isoform X2 n=1 Tax=Glossina fuscipes TaxID=7396 RepID=A0A9C5ZBA3_9MUSC|nr:neurogenic protein big brain isoform X2 [Glossina fuscipes]
MTDDTLQTLPLDTNIDAHIITLFERLETMRRDQQTNAFNSRLSSTLQPKKNMQAEIRTLEFWRSVISECLASFFYVFIVCGAAAGAGVGASVSSVLLATALASGLAMGTLTQCFLHISGAHINPAVTLASCVIRTISPMRATMYITAQCGGGIAGAALLYGVTVPGYQGNLQAAISHNASLAAWERLGVEFILTFVVVLTYFISTDSVKKVMGNSAPSIAASYSACSFVSMPYLNPARSLGPSFVLNKWENHWVYWFGPLIGGFASGLVYEYIFNTRRNVRRIKINMENDTSSINSEDDLNYDLDMEKPNMHNKFQGTYPTAQATSGHGQSNTNSGKSNGGNYCQNLYTTPPLLNKFEQSEPLYGGTRSMYCRSPTLMRTNLNRSQSVYAKSNTALNRDIVPRSGPLVPAQSLYPLRLGFSQHRAQSSHLQNQNVQNQLQQRSESVYAIRSLRQNQLQQQQQQHSTQIKQQQQQQRHQQPQQAPQHMQQSQPVAAQQGQTAQENQACFQAVYGTRLNPNPNDGHLKFDRRPETVYGMTMPGNRGQSAQSDDSSYGSYPSSSVTPPARTEPPPVLLYAPPPHPNSVTTPPLRTQSERKVSAPVVASQASTISMGQYNANQSSTPNQTEITSCTQCKCNNKNRAN